jgi:c-di-GMP-binding flagellar brake protein YcgR
MERRTKSRIDVQLTCCVEPGRAQATPVRALTENVSRNGMLMLWSGGSPVPEVDGKLTLDVLLPENSDFGPRVMRCRTEVTRVLRRAAEEHEVGLRVLSMRFIKPGTAPAKPRGVTRSVASSDNTRKKSTSSKRTRTTRDLASMPVATERVS